MVNPWIDFPTLLGDDDLSNLVSYPLYLPQAGTTTAAANNVSLLTRYRKLEEGDVVRILEHDAVINQGSPKSLQQLTDLSDYTVTSGKTAKLILILRTGSADAQFKVWESSAADTASGTAKYTYAGNGFDSGHLITVCPEWDVTEKTFAASKYITIEVTSSGDNVSVTQAIVIES